MPSRRAVAFRWHTKLDDFITQVAWSPDGTRLGAASVSGQVFIFDVATDCPLHRLEPAHADGCDALAWRPDGHAFATAGRDGKWRLWDAATGKPLAEHAAGALWPEHATWSSGPADGSKGDRGSAGSNPTSVSHSALLAVSAGSQVSLWNEAGEPVGEPMKFPRAVVDLAWVLGGSTLAVALSTGVHLCDPAGGEERELAARDPILCLAMSPSGKWLLTGNQDCSLHVWNTDSGAEMHMRGYPAKVRQLAWHRASRWIATGGGPSVAVWDCSGRGPEGRAPTMLEFHTDIVTALHYQPAGDWLASGSRDGGIAVWSPTQREQLITGAKIPSGVTRVAWSPDGKLLAVGGEAGEVQVLAVE
jgi:WD40 repeat protein